MQLIVAQAVSSVIKSRFHLVALAGGCFAAALLGQILSAQFGFFGLAGSILAIATLLALAIVAAGSLLLTWLRDTKTAADQASHAISKPGLGWAVIAIAAGVCYAVRWVHPTENILGGYDEGIYTITAANMARTGHYRLNAVLLPSLPAELRPWIIAQLPRMANRTTKPPPRYPCYHPCLFVADEAHGALTSQFPVGFPALLGSAHAVAGFNGQRLLNPLLLFVTACLAGMLLTSWLGVGPGGATFVLWLWFPLQVWGGNTRFAELLLQCLWMLTLFGLAERKFHPSWSGGLAGLALGASFAVKIDALPVVAITTVLVASSLVRKERTFFRTFIVTLVLGAAISATALWVDNRAYALDTLRSIAETNRRPLVCGLISAATVSCAWALARRHGRWAKARESWPRRRVWIEGGAIGAGLAVAAYAYFVRSHPTIADNFYYWPQERVIPSYREETFFRLGWYWQPWGLALVVLGIAAAFRHIREIWQELAVGIGLLFLIAFAYDIRNNPIQPYAFRRFLPYAVPIMIFGAAAVSHWLPRTWLRTRAWLNATLTAGLLLGFWRVNERLNSQAEYPALIKQTTEVAELIPRNAVILISVNDQLVRLASGMEFIFGKPSLAVHWVPQLPGRENALRHALQFWQEQGRPVFLLSPHPGETLGVSGATSRPIWQGRIQTKATIASEKRLVAEQTPLDLPYALNELTLASPAPTAPHRSP